MVVVVDVEVVGVDLVVVVVVVIVVTSSLSDVVVCSLVCSSDDVVVVVFVVLVVLEAGPMSLMSSPSPEPEPSNSSLIISSTFVVCSSGIMVSVVCLSTGLFV